MTDEEACALFARTMPGWRIEPATKLRAAMERDLLLCHTEHERLLCRTICEKKIREAADRGTP